MLHFSVQRHSMIYSRLIFWCDYHSHVKSVDELLKEVPGMSQAHSMHYAKQNTNSKLVIIVQWQQIFLVEAKSFSVIMVDSWHYQIRNVWLSKLASQRIPKELQDSQRINEPVIHSEIQFSRKSVTSLVLNYKMHCRAILPFDIIFSVNEW